MERIKRMIPYHTAKQIVSQYYKIDEDVEDIYIKDFFSLGFFFGVVTGAIIVATIFTIT